MKLSGSYTLPFDILIAGTYQFSRGVQTGGAGPSIQANWAGPERGRQSANRPQLDRHRIANHSADSRRSGVRRSQPEPARSAGVEARRVRPLPAARGLRRLQRVQQQLAVHRQLDLLDGGHDARGCVRPTCCRAGSSNWARRCRSNARQLPTTNAQLPTTPNFQLPNWELGWELVNWESHLNL